MKNLIVIGVVGQIASGKGILVNYLIEKLGFSSFSLSSIVHAELQKRGVKKYTRQALQDMGDELRQKEGDDVLARRIIDLILHKRYNDYKFYKNYNDYKRMFCVIEGIRNPGEVKFLKKNPNFILIGVKSKRELRFQRLLSRGKEWDPKTYEDFLKVDRRDIGIGQDKSGQQVGKCLAYCDYVLTNNKGLEDFERKVDKLMRKIKANT